MINLFKKKDKATDPVCLMKVEKGEKAITYNYKEETYYKRFKQYLQLKLMEEE